MRDGVVMSGRGGDVDKMGESVATVATALGVCRDEEDEAEDGDLGHRHFGAW